MVNIGPSDVEDSLIPNQVDMLYNLLSVGKAWCFILDKWY
jgi:hypothetical protein